MVAISKVFESAKDSDIGKLMQYLDMSLEGISLETNEEGKRAAEKTTAYLDMRPRIRHCSLYAQTNAHPSCHPLRQYHHGMNNTPAD